MTTEISLYIKLDNKVYFLCELLQKILLTTNDKVIILTNPDIEIQEELSHALWSFIPNSFLAHEILNEIPEEPPVIDVPIVITSYAKFVKASKNDGILIDLSFSNIENNQFQKVIFLCGEDELETARTLYRKYQKKQNPPKFFDMSTYPRKKPTLKSGF